MGVKDFKNRAARKKARKCAPVWICLVIGYVLGGFSVGMIWWSQSAEISNNPSWIGDKPKSVQPVAPASETKTKTSPKIEPPEFDFYSLLPELEVVVPEEELAGTPRKPPEDKTKIKTKPQKPEVIKPPVVPKSGYLIQVSSFRNGRDADSLKAGLAMLGLHAQVNKANIKGTTWHRVRVGPYKSAAEVQRVRRQLVNSGHKTMVIKIKP